MDSDGGIWLHQDGTETEAGSIVHGCDCNHCLATTQKEAAHAKEGEKIEGTTRAINTTGRAYILGGATGRHVMDSADDDLTNGMVHAYATDQDVVRQAMINPGWAFSDAPEPGSGIAPNTGTLRIRMPTDWAVGRVIVMGAGLVHAQADIPVTAGMIIAGNEAAIVSGHLPLSEDVTAATYRAMAALAPRTGYDPEYRAMSDQLGDAIRERDAANEKVGLVLGRTVVLQNRLDMCGRMLRNVTEDNSALGATNERLRDEISALTAEKNALHDRLADYTVGSGAAPGTRPHASDCAIHNEPASAVGPCDCGATGHQTTKGQVPGPPNHNPFREFPADRRRIGG